MKPELCPHLKLKPEPLCNNPDSPYYKRSTSKLICLVSDKYECAWKYYMEYKSNQSEETENDTDEEVQIYEGSSGSM